MEAISLAENLEITELPQGCDCWGVDCRRETFLIGKISRLCKEAGFMHLEKQWFLFLKMVRSNPHSTTQINLYTNRCIAFYILGFNRWDRRPINRVSFDLLLQAAI